MSALDDDYQAKVANAALAAIIDLYGDKGGQSGVVEPQGAINGLCLAIALMAHNIGHGGTPKARREMADQCRKGVLQALNAIVTAQEAGVMPEWIRAKVIANTN